MKQDKQFRIKAHSKFDLLWRSGRMTRANAYSWLAKRMGIPEDACHIKLFNKTQCQQVISIVEKYTESEGISFAKLQAESAQQSFKEVAYDE